MEIKEVNRPTLERVTVTEKDHVHDQWYKDASSQTLDSIGEFLHHLGEDYNHDYGTICHAIAAGAIAAAHAIDRGPQGGITGFQAGAIMWEFIRKWQHYDDIPLRLTKFDDMLYPQSEYRFNTITKETAKWLQDKAKALLTEKEDVHPNVKAHWEKLAKGWIPFGYSIQED